MNIKYLNEVFPCTKAVKGDSYIKLYDGESIVAEFLGICDFTAFTIENGQWSDPEPTDIERLQARVDYIGMMTEVI